MTEDETRQLCRRMAELLTPVDMTWAKFNEFTERAIGVRLQEHMSKVLGYGASVDNSLRRYASSGEDVQKFITLAIALRNSKIIGRTWTGEMETEYGTCKGLFDDVFRSGDERIREKPFEVPKPPPVELRVLDAQIVENQRAATILANGNPKEVMAELGEIKGEIKDGVAQTNALIKAHMTPRPADYVVTQGQLCAILDGLNCGRGVKTISRWEKYLSTDGREGTEPPDGYTLQTRLTLTSATAWAQSFASAEKSKLNVKCAFDERRMGGRQ